MTIQSAAHRGRIAAIAVLLAVLLAPASVWAQERVTLTFWSFVDAHIDYYEARAAEFNAMRPDIEFALESVSMPWAEMHDQLMISLQTGIGAPDIVDIEINPFPRFVREPIFLHELDDMVEPFKDVLFEARLSAYSSGGKLYGIPTHLGAYVAYYNTEVLEAAGIDYNSIVTWEDFREAGRQFNAHYRDGLGENRWFAMLDGHGWFQYWGMISQQGSGISDASGEVILDNDVNIRTLNYLRELIEEDILLADGTGLHDVIAYDLINSGDVAAIWMPQWYMIRYTEFMPDLEGKVAIRPLPVWSESDQYVSAMGGGTGTAITVYIDDDKLQIAKDFLEYAKLTREANILIWTEFGFDPFRSDVYTDPQLADPLPYFNNESVMDVILGYGDRIAPQYRHPQWEIVRDEIVFETVLFPVLVERSRDAADALRDAAAQIRQLR